MDNQTYAEYCRLQGELRSLGVGQTVDPSLVKSLKQGRPYFNIHYGQEMANNKVFWDLHFYQLDNAKHYSLHRYTGTLRHDIMIPDIRLNGVNVKELDNRMRQINWTFDEPERNLERGYLNDPRKIENTVYRIMMDLGKLEDSDHGREIARKLEAKYFYQSGLTEDHPLKDVYDRILKDHSHSHTFYLQNGHGPGIDLAYNMLTGLLPLEQENKPVPLYHVNIRQLSPYEFIMSNGRIAMTKEKHRFFTSLKMAYDHVQTIDERQFQPRHVLDKNLDFVVQGIDILDGLNNIPIATKRALWQSEQMKDVPNGSLSWWLNEKKIKASEFEQQTGFPLTKMKTLSHKPFVYVLNKTGLRSTHPVPEHYLTRRKHRRGHRPGGI